MTGYALVLERVAALSEQLEGEARVQAERVVELCRELELQAQAGDLTGASALVGRIESEYAAVAAELRR